MRNGRARGEKNQVALPVVSRRRDRGGAALSKPWQRCCDLQSARLSLIRVHHGEEPEGTHLRRLQQLLRNTLSWDKWHDVGGHETGGDRESRYNHPLMRMMRINVLCVGYRRWSSRGGLAAAQGAQKGKILSRVY